MSTADKIVATLHRNRTVWSLRRNLTQATQQTQVVLPAQIEVSTDPALAPLGTEIAASTDEFNGTTLGAMWTQLNWAASTTAFSVGRLIWTVTASGNAAVNATRGLITPVPSTSPTLWSCRCRVASYSTGAINLAGGLIVYRSNSGTLLTMNSIVRVANPASTPYAAEWYATYWASVSSPTANVYGPSSADDAKRDNYFQVRYNGTTLYMDFSPDNVNYINLGSVTSATALGGAPTHIGLSGNAPHATLPAILGYDFFRTYDTATLNQYA